MSVILNQGKGIRHCDWCGKNDVKIQRRYKGEGYCANCYKTWFVKKNCFKCGDIHRLHKKEEHSICSECLRKSPCIRCSKDAYVNGINTRYGRSCQVCYNGYFKDKKQCFSCGDFKRNVSRYTELKHNQPVCTACFQRSCHESCPQCKRFRKLLDTPDGKKCKKCHELGYITCNDCEQLMPAGRGLRCENCYWLKKLTDAVELNTYLFYSESIKTSYRDFIDWYVNKLSAREAFLKHDSFVDFFVVCDDLWGELRSYESLVGHFKPSGLWHNLTVLRWLVDTDQVIVDEKLKIELAEKSYIENALSVFEEIPKCLYMYHEFLLDKQTKKNTATRSIRLALRPAIDICTTYKVLGSETPIQGQIERYLADKRGQYSNLYGFVTFLNREYELKLICKRPEKQGLNYNNVRKEQEKQIQQLIKKESLTETDVILWYQLCGAYFHDIKVGKDYIQNFKFEVFSSDKLVKLEHKTKVYWLPNHTK